MYLSQRTITLMQQPPEPVVPVPADPETVPEPWPDNALEPEPTPMTPAVPRHGAPGPVQSGIDASHIVHIQGRAFVKFAGLLALAHQRGLQSLKVEWTSNTEALSLAHAIAVFPFGTFAESGDATPENVNRKVAPHFRRCALTRASARCLRLALGLDMVAVEELGGTDDV